jgi:hypothetical protein
MRLPCSRRRPATLLLPSGGLLLRPLGMLLLRLLAMGFDLVCRRFWLSVLPGLRSRLMCRRFLWSRLRPLRRGLLMGGLGVRGLLRPRRGLLMRGLLMRWLLMLRLRVLRLLRLFRRGLLMRWLLMRGLRMRSRLRPLRRGLLMRGLLMLRLRVRRGVRLRGGLLLFLLFRFVLRVRGRQRPGYQKQTRDAGSHELHTLRLHQSLDNARPWPVRLPTPASYFLISCAAYSGPATGGASTRSTASAGFLSVGRSVVPKSALDSVAEEIWLAPVSFNVFFAR